MASSRHTNALINETSPYLLQHAHNPVDWHPWNESTIAKAKALDKLLLISIGYAACHWCHVMEKESFEDEEVAAIMNKHFICIKVDREERPDVDQIYMNAVQLITGSGGWPLNCFALPDGKPFFGGTYFRRSQWIQLLENIALLFSVRRKEVEDQAASLAAEVVKSDFILTADQNHGPDPGMIREALSRLEKQFDLKEGGFGGAPKFPMPANLTLMLRHANLTNNKPHLDFINLTLTKMAYGGIYDQLGGGFARYSTDTHWKVPHFEKMLYDNAQLISLYSEAFQITGDLLYKETVDETIRFLNREMASRQGGFFSSLDADSEGEEGKYYTWGTAEIGQILGNHADLIRKYYHIGGKGFWEMGRNILLRTQSAADFARDQGLHPSAFKGILKPAKAKLLKARSKRVKPGLDNKILTSWNGLMIKAMADAFRAFGKKEYQESAISNARFFISNLMEEDGRLFHSWNHSKASINGFLEDYSFLSEGLLSLYQVTFDEIYLEKAKLLADYAIAHFYDKETGLFFLTSDLDPPLIARKHELYDNVIPSSNSCLAEVLNVLGLIYEDENYLEIASRMLLKMKDPFQKYPSAFANWGSVMLKTAWPFYTVVITGPEFRIKAAEMQQLYLPNVFFCGSESGSGLPIFKDRFTKDETMIYVCSGKECQLPTHSIKEAFSYISQSITEVFTKVSE